jgi:hypothetical protein
MLFTLKHCFAIFVPCVGTVSCKNRTSQGRSPPSLLTEAGPLQESACRESHGLLRNQINGPILAQAHSSLARQIEAPLGCLDLG